MVADFGRFNIQYFVSRYVFKGSDTTGKIVARILNTVGRIRAKRRFLEEQKKDNNITLEKIEQQIKSNP